MSMFITHRGKSRLCLVAREIIPSFQSKLHWLKLLWEKGLLWRKVSLWPVTPYLFVEWGLSDKPVTPLYLKSSLLWLSWPYTQIVFPVLYDKMRHGVWLLRAYCQFDSKKTSQTWGGMFGTMLLRITNL